MNIFLEDKINLPAGEPVQFVLYSHQKDGLMLAVVYQKKVLFFDDLNKPLEYQYDSE